MNQEFPSVNGIDPSWADIGITFTVDGGIQLTTSDITGIKSGVKGEVGERRGASGGRVMARTTGSVSYEASITFTRSGLRKLKRALMSVAPTRGNQVLIGLATFDISVQHTPPGETDIYHRKIKGCRYLGESDDSKEGTEADTLECALSTIEIVDIIDGQEVVLI